MMLHLPNMKALGLVVSLKMFSCFPYVTPVAAPFLAPGL